MKNRTSIIYALAAMALAVAFALSIPMDKGFLTAECESAVATIPEVE